MSSFLASRHSQLKPYVPGEQPKLKNYIKLNANENPFPPSPKVTAAVEAAAKTLNMYPDANYTALREVLAKYNGFDAANIICGNGSDDILNLAFMAFADENCPAVFPDITYSFYKVFCELHHISYREIPVNADFSINVEDYCNVGGTVFIANPNAPSCLSLTTDDIEKIVSSNKGHVVVIDEAYVDFGKGTCAGLIRKYDNLVVSRTLSKSFSLAGSRLGYGIASETLIGDMNTIRNSLNPYNVNSMTVAAGIAAIEDAEYMRKNCAEIKATRDWTRDELLKLGFVAAPTDTNFVFATHPKYEATWISNQLRERGVFVRHFSANRINAYLRISTGTKAQMEVMVNALKEILK